MEGPRASGHRTCSSEQRDCLPTASFGRGGNCGEPTAKAGAHLKRDPSQSRGLPQGKGQESSLLPDFGDPTNGVAFPEGIQRSEFFNAALQVAAYQGPFAAFLKRSLVPIRADAGPAARSDLWPCPPPCWGVGHRSRSCLPGGGGSIASFASEHEPCSTWWWRSTG